MTILAAAPGRDLALVREPAAFAVLCVIWGTTWIAMKAGVDSVPPLLFAGTRFLVDRKSVV